MNLNPKKEVVAQRNQGSVSGKNWGAERGGCVGTAAGSGRGAAWGPGGGSAAFTPGPPAPRTPQAPGGGTALLRPAGPPRPHPPPEGPRRGSWREALVSLPRSPEVSWALSVCPAPESKRGAPARPRGGGGAASGARRPGVQGRRPRPPPEVSCSLPCSSAGRPLRPARPAPLTSNLPPLTSACSIYL